MLVNRMGLLRFRNVGGTAYVRSPERSKNPRISRKIPSYDTLRPLTNFHLLEIVTIKQYMFGTFIMQATLPA